MTASNLLGCRLAVGLVLLALVAALPAPLAAAGAEDVRARLGSLMPTLDGSSDIQVTANRMGADRGNNRVTLEDDVLIRFSDITLRCDRATYDSATGDIQAEGNISVESTSGGSWQGERLHFNHRTGEGLVGAGIIRHGTFTVKAGDDLVRDDEGTFHASNATVTTCVNDEADWHWSVTGDARYKDREFVEMRNAVVRLYGLPVLWAPYYYRDLNTNYGWRIMPGYTDKWGAYLRVGYV